MDLFKILDSPPEHTIIDPNNFKVDPQYAASKDYKIITPLTDFQKELFDQIVSLHYSDILKFYIQFENDNGDLKDQLIIDSLQVMLENSLRVSNHPYLLIDHFFPKNLTSKDIYKKLVETSGKFKILNDLLNIIESLYVVSNNTGSNSKKNNSKKNNNTPATVSNTPETTSINSTRFNLVIVCKPGKCTDLIESLLMGHTCCIKRYSGEKLSSGNKTKKNQNNNSNNSNNTVNNNAQDCEKNQFVVHLLPSEISELNQTMYDEELIPATADLNLLISFDISVNTEDEYIARLISGSGPGSNIPILRLVPNNTIEHIALHFRKSFKDKRDTAYLKPVTAAIVCLRDRVGLISSELKSVYATDLEYLRDWFKGLSPDTLVVASADAMNTNSKDGAPPSSSATASDSDSAWPLPDLRPIDNFKSSDVEKSLLKEVTFENDEDELLQLPNHYKIRPKSKKSYYKSKRLTGSYITNPIEYESYNKITGISSNIPENTSILTHRLILNCNLMLQRYEILQQEWEVFEQNKEIREADVKVVNDSYDKIYQEVEVLKQGIADKNKEIEMRQEEVNDLKQDLNEIDTKITESDTIAAGYLERQELKESIDLKMQNKKQENEYMKKEINNAKEAIIENESKISLLLQENNTIKEQLNNRPAISFNDIDTTEAYVIQRKELTRQNQELSRILEKDLKKINDIPISQKLRINGVNNNIYSGGNSTRR